MDEITLFGDTMFHTQAQAELQFRKAYASPGQHTWSYVELAVQIPYLLVSVEQGSGDDVVGRDFLFGGLKDVVDLVEQQSESFKITTVKLLSPAYMNGSEGYQLGEVKEIWASTNGWKRREFVMSDNSKLKFCLPEGTDERSEMELLIAL